MPPSQDVSHKLIANTQESTGTGDRLGVSSIGLAFLMQDSLPKEQHVEKMPYLRFQVWLVDC
jgi:hypothetical protein